MSLIAFLTPAVMYLAIFVLSLWLPAQRVEGYITDPETGAPQIYYLNGLRVLLAMVSIGALLVWGGWFSWSWLYLFRWELLAGAFVLGIVYTLYLVLPAQPTGKPFLADLFLGRTLNHAHFGRVDVKMYLYVVGAVVLFLNTWSAVHFHVNLYPWGHNPGVVLHAILISFFVLDYLFFERVHLWTYDIFAERLGFKLAWGCFVFYPFFYFIGLWSTADLPTPDVIHSLGWVWLVGCTLVFFCGWMLARGANMQKYTFKRDPQANFMGIAPVTIGQGDRQVLASGFWGQSRHINYLGEVLMALGIAASLGHVDVIWPWLYPLYYVILLGTRERDDDARCEEKYGEVWRAYKKAVPYRIIPRLY